MTFDAEILQQRVTELMRGGMLFGEATLLARAEQRLKSMALVASQAESLRRALESHAYDVKYTRENRPRQRRANTRYAERWRSHHAAKHSVGGGA